MASEEMILEYCFANLSFQLLWQPIKFRDLDKICMSGRGLLKENFCQNNCNEIAIKAYFHFSHYNSMETKLSQQ